MVDGWIAPLPHCPVHGQMSYRSQTRPIGGGVSVIVRSEWICHGWDGEGCDHAVDSDDLPWVPLSQDESGLPWPIS